MPISYQAEQFTTEFYNEVLPIFEQHYIEIAEDKEVIGPLDVRYENYIELARIGALEVMVARDDGIIIGYIMAVVDHSLHYRTLCRARVDIYYVIKDYRQRNLRRPVAADLFDAFEQRMRERKVSIIYASYKEAHPHGNFFNSIGYRPFERQVCKVISDE